MDIFDHPYYRYNKRIMLMIGQWPYQDRKIRLFGVWFVTPIIISLIIPTLLRPFTCQGSRACNTEVIATITLLLAMLIKYYMCYFGANKIKRLFNLISEEWQMQKSEGEMKVMNQYAQEGRLYTLGYIIYICITSVVILAVPFFPMILDYIVPLNETRPLRLITDVEYFVDKRENFYYLTCHIYVVFLIGAKTIMVVDVLFLVLTSHVCGAFATVGYRLEHLLEENSTEKISSKRQYKACTDTVVYIIKAHKRAIEFADLMEDFFSLPFFLISGLSVICMSASLFQLATLMAKPDEILKYVMFVVAQLFHMFITSYPGQRLIDHSSEICFKAYSGLWYEAPLNVRKMLLFIIRRSEKPCILTAGKLLVFCLETFSTIVQTSMSYYMVLSNTQ